MELQIPQQTGAVATRPDEQHLIKTSLKHSKRSKIDVTLLLPHYTVDPDRAVLCDDDPNKLEMSLGSTTLPSGRHEGKHLDLCL